MSVMLPHVLHFTHYKQITSQTSLMDECIRLFRELDAEWDVSPWKNGSCAALAKKNIQRIGITSADLDQLSVIHLSGTKGKGSTCAYVESILRCSGYKTGFFSSPHLVGWRDRIRINGRPIQEEIFVRHFWDCYNSLLNTQGPDDGGMPNSFRMCLLMAVKIFREEQVDVSVLEVGIGGEYDSTNIVTNPVTCGVTSLGLDHVGELGDTVEDIAWHKAGIFKPGVVAFTVEQPDDSINVLLKRAKDNGNPVYMVPNLEDYGWGDNPLKLGIHGNVQKLNASLALQLCQAWIQDHGKSINDRKYKRGQESQCLGSAVDTAPGFDLTPGMIIGLRDCRWPGRSQIISRPRVTYYLDGAHTRESMQHCVGWFQHVSRQEREKLSGRVRRVLVFNMTGDRDVCSLLEILLATDMDLAAFCPNLDTRGHAEEAGNKAAAEFRVRSESYKATWDHLIVTSHHSTVPSLEVRDRDATEDHEETTRTFPCIEDALIWATNGLDPDLRRDSWPGASGSGRFAAADHVQVLCTGSLYLVGGCIRVLEPKFLDK